MKAVFPVTLANAGLYSQLSRLFEKMGPNKEHELYIVSCPAALEHAQAFAQSCKKLFLNVDIGVVANIVENTAIGRNQMFRDAVYLLEKAGNTSAWMWMENAYPVDVDWLTMVQEEYNTIPRDRYYLGCIEKTYYRAKDLKTGKILLDPPRFVEKRKHMRFGVYPADFGKRSAILSNLGDVPFEQKLQEEIVPFCHESKVLATLWASKNYEAANSGRYFKGEQSPEFESEIRKNEPVNVAIEGLAVVHGCRDGSLGMLLLGKHWVRSERPVRKPVASVSSVDIAAQLKVLQSANEALLQRIKELEAPAVLSEEELLSSDGIDDTSASIEITGESAIEPVPITVTPASKRVAAASAAKRKRGRPKRVATA
jgi:hypothetical protein